MKTQEELILTLSDVSGILYTDVITRDVVKAAMAKRVARNLVKPNTDLKGKPGTQLKIPKRARLTADTVATGSTMTLSTPTYDSVTIEVEQVGVGVSIGKDVIEASLLNIVNDQIENLGEAIADKEDVDIIEALLTQTTVSSENAGTGDGSETSFGLSHGGVIEVSEVLVGATTSTAYSVDYYAGAIKFSSAPGSGSTVTVSYKYAASLTVIDVVSAGVLGYEDIISAKVTVQGNNYNPDTLLIHPNEAGDLLKNSKFIDASQYGNNQPIVNGEIGKIAGLRVVVSQNMKSGCALVFDSKEFAVYAVKKEIWTDQFNNTHRNTIDIMARLWSKAGVINNSAAALIVGGNSNAV